MLSLIRFWLKEWINVFTDNLSLGAVAMMEKSFNSDKEIFKDLGIGVADK